VDGLTDIVDEMSRNFRMLKPKLAIATRILWGVDPSEWRGRLSRMRAWGYRGIAVDDNALEEESPQAGLKFRTFAQELGLDVARVSATLQPDLPEWADLAVRVEHLLDWTLALGAHELCLADLEPQAAKPLTERAWVARSAHRWKKVARQAAERSVRLHWNLTHDNRSAPLTSYELVLRAVDEPNFGLEFCAGTMEVLALATGHEHSDEGKPLRGVLGLLERFKGDIAGVTLGISGAVQTDPERVDDQVPLDWNSLIPALVDAGIPDAWWVVDTDPGSEEPAVRKFLDLLAPYLSDAPGADAPPTK
jgi:hypothetical protein